MVWSGEKVGLRGSIEDGLPGPWGQTAPLGLWGECAKGKKL